MRVSYANVFTCCSIHGIKNICFTVELSNTVTILPSPSVASDFNTNVLKFHFLVNDTFKASLLKKHGER